jgi:hypothetical protein
MQIRKGYRATNSLPLLHNPLLLPAPSNRSQTYNYLNVNTPHINYKNNNRRYTMGLFGKKKPKYPLAPMYEVAPGIYKYVSGGMYVDENGNPIKNMSHELKKSLRRGRRQQGPDGFGNEGFGPEIHVGPRDPRKRPIGPMDVEFRDHTPFGPAASHHSMGGGDSFGGPGPSHHSMGGFYPFDPPPMPSHHSMGGGNPFGFDHPRMSSHHSMGGGGFNPFDQLPPDFGPPGGISSHYSAFDPFDNQPPFTNQNFSDEPSFPPNNNNFGAPTAPQFRSNAHPASTSARGHASLPAPRPGKVREGDPLPTGMFDPLKSSSAAVPKGHHGLREHKPGMTNLHVGKGTSAENPAGKWEFLDELMRTDRNGGGSKRDGGSKRSGGGGSRYTHSAR